MDQNPYQAPQNTASPPSGLQPATRGQRFAAAMTDALVASVFSLPLMYYMGAFELLKNQQAPTAGYIVTSTLAGFCIYMALHGYLLRTAGQTIGKRLIGIRIVTLDDRLPSLGTLIIQRYLPVMLAAQLPVVGPLLVTVDALMIFRADRRCLHDHWAGTKVVKA